ncbi:endocuticle structural glycoprotein ABD-4-like [Pollicipes pollicipes]|uniref:endocuticle structural glycoprotein ABD-4-like n=1 Tax=Pollicipes pollicipes TaxID=41117 RepID=UPI001885763E|nr:endocuticle structural glycoprotein ABD-4-like [Pollicipes pollicipes]XP_037074769.1 endocuticle structural glycoprotein ABD-4-like [Pollicipes pollicipes]
MKLFIVAAVLAVAAADRRPAPPAYSAPAPPSYSAPAQPSYSAPKYAPKVIEILSQEFDLRDDQSYDSSYQTANGIYASESGQAVAGYGGEQSYAVQGQYSYTGDDGVSYTVTYVADANGFQPQGDHLPTPVPTEYPTPEVPVTQASYQAAPAPSYQAAPAPSYQAAPAPSYQAAPAPSYQAAPAQSYQPAPAPQYQPTYQ